MTVSVSGINYKYNVSDFEGKNVSPEHSVDSDLFRKQCSQTYTSRDSKNEIKLETFRYF